MILLAPKSCVIHEFVYLMNASLFLDIAAPILVARQRGTLQRFPSPRIFMKLDPKDPSVGRELIEHGHIKELIFAFRRGRCVF